jgi:hypothetical protein
MNKSSLFQSPFKSLTLLGLLWVFCIHIQGVLFAQVTLHGTQFYSGEGSYLSVQRPSGVNPGDLLLISVETSAGFEASIVGVPDGWVLLSNISHGKEIGLQTLYKVVGMEESSVYDFSLSQSTTWLSSISRISGQDLLNPVKGVSGTAGFGSTIIGNEISSSEQGGFVFGFFALKGNVGNWSELSSPMIVNGSQNSAMGSLMVATMSTYSDATTGNKSVTCDMENHWSSQMVSINPVAVGDFD